MAKNGLHRDINDYLLFLLKTNKQNIVFFKIKYSNLMRSIQFPNQHYR